MGTSRGTVRTVARSAADDEDDGPARVPIRPRTPRKKLARHQPDPLGATGMSHDELVEGLRAIEGLRDVGKTHPVFHYRSKPFLHFHDSPEGRYADVRLGSGDFEPVWASTGVERLALLAKVTRHIEKLERARKGRTR